MKISFMKIKNINEDEAEYRFYREMLTYLHLDFQNFFVGVANDDRYECLIYDWIFSLYEQKTSIEEAKNLLLKLRHDYFFKKLKL